MKDHSADVDYCHCQAHVNVPDVWNQTNSYGEAVTQTADNKDPKQTGFSCTQQWTVLQLATCLFATRLIHSSHKSPLLLREIFSLYSAHSKAQNRCEIIWHRIPRIPCTALFAKIYFLVTTQSATNDNLLSLFSIRIPAKTYKCL